MMRVVCHTNLDLAGERWPDELPAVPHVGDQIQSRTKHGCFQLCLQVHAVRWEYCEHLDRYIPKIELHMTDTQRSMPVRAEERHRWPDAQPGSIIAFYGWYAPLVGRSVFSFIG